MIARLRARPSSARPVRGTVSSVIVVKEPGPCFREALFILRDEYLADASRDRDALLREAREAAAAFTGARERKAPRLLLWLLPALLLALAAALWLLL